MSVDVTYDDPNHSATITIDDPAQKNALSEEVLHSLLDALAEVETNEGVRACVLTGRGDTFSAGANIQDFLDRRDDPNSVHDYLAVFFDLYERVVEFPVPVVGKINGPAIGGASELAMSCDLRVASTTAELRQAEIDLGLVPPFEQLRRHLPENFVREYCYTGRSIGAQEAGEMNLFNRVADPADLDRVTAEFVAEISAKSRASLALTKEALRYGDGKSVGESQSHRLALDHQCVHRDRLRDSLDRLAADRDAE